MPAALPTWMRQATHLTEPWDFQTGAQASEFLMKSLFIPEAQARQLERTVVQDPGFDKAVARALVKVDGRVPPLQLGAQQACVLQVLGRVPQGAAAAVVRLRCPLVRQDRFLGVAVQLQRQTSLCESQCSRLASPAPVRLPCASAWHLHSLRH